MSGECDDCGEHTLECLCEVIRERKWTRKEEKEMSLEDNFCHNCKNESVACVCMLDDFIDTLIIGS